MTAARVVASAGRRGNRAGIGCLIAMLILVGTGVCPADIQNPSFELGPAGSSYVVPFDWARTAHPAFVSYRTNLWATDRTYSATVFSRPTVRINAGDYEAFSQGVDLVDVGCIEFDVKLVAYNMNMVAQPDDAFANFEASLLIGGFVVWRQTAGGIYLNQRANVPAGLPAWPSPRIELRTKAVDGGTFQLSYCTLWDNLRLLEGPEAIPAVIRFEPATLNLSSEGKWVTCFIELGEDYDVRTIDGATVTLNDISAHVDESGWAAPQANELNVADFDGNGTLERLVRFDRAALQAIVAPPEATITVKGRQAGGTAFEGTAVLRVIGKDAQTNQMKAKQ